MKKIVITVIAVMAILAVTLFIATSSVGNDSGKRNSFTPEEEFAYSELLDTVMAKLPDNAKVVARISNSSQYSLVYMQDGHLYIFDAADNQNREIEPQKLNVAARVSHSDGGILASKVDADETCIMIVAAMGAKNNERGLYRYDLQRRKISVLAIGKVESNGSGYIVYEKELEVHFNASGDKISEMLNNESFGADSDADANDDKPVRRRRSEQVDDEEQASVEGEQSIAEQPQNDVILEPVPRLDN